MSYDYKTILEEHKDDTGLLKELVSNINGWDGSFDDLEVHEFDESFFDMMFEGSPMEAVRAAHFGEIESWGDEYIRFNGYGNLESLSEYKYDQELADQADEIIERAIEYIGDGHIDIDYYIEQNDLAEEE